MLAAIPATAKAVAVLDRTKEPGAGAGSRCSSTSPQLSARPTRPDAETTCRSCRVDVMACPSKEFTPAMVVGIYDELALPSPRPRFTIGINDDVTMLSLPYDPSVDLEDPATLRAVFYGLGSDGTVGANKNSVKILGGIEGTYAQGYYVYDSKKSGSRTVSHLRFGPKPIEAPYLVSQAGFIGCHHWSILERVDVLEFAAPGTVLLINAPFGPDDVFAPAAGADAGQDHRARHRVVDDRRQPGGSQGWHGSAHEHRPANLLLRHLEGDAASRGDRGGQGPRSARPTRARAPTSLPRTRPPWTPRWIPLFRVDVPSAPVGEHQMIPPVPSSAPEFVRSVTGSMLAGTGDQLPVSRVARWTAPTRPAPPGTRSATSPT